MSQWKINWIEGIENDFISRDDLFNVKEKMDIISENPNSHSKRVKGIFGVNLRRVRFGQFRLFIFLDPIIEEIYCLAYLPKKKCYSRKSMNKVLTLVKQVSN